MVQSTNSSISSETAGSGRLKRNALGLPSALGMSLAFISPTIGVIFISSLIGGQAGVASPFVFLLGTVGIALMAFSISEFARRVTSAGGFYKFVSLGLGNHAGFVCGIVLLFAYALQSPLNSNLFGGFVSTALASDFGINIPWWVLTISIVVLVGALSWYSVHTSMSFGIAFLIAEVAVAALLVTNGSETTVRPCGYRIRHEDEKNASVILMRILQTHR